MKNPAGSGSVTESIEGINWDLSSGLAESAARKKLLSILSADKEAPSGVFHVGLLAYGKQYEYGDGGFRTKSFSGYPESCTTIHSSGNVTDVYDLGTTSKSVTQFESWIDTEAKEEFSPSKYCMSKNNCAHWGIAACDFLSVEPPQDWIKLCKMTEKNYPLIRCLNVGEKIIKSLRWW